MSGAMNLGEILKWLERRGSRKGVKDKERYGIVGVRAFGVSVGTTRTLAKRIGKDHALASKLWASGWYEARILAAFVDDPEQVTLRQMNAWAADFDNWAVCDTVCFHLFDRSPLSWRKARQWASAKPEFVKRAGFVLMACLALHDKSAPDEAFLAWIPLIGKGARDERNFVKKAVSWALRSIGRRSAALHAASLRTAARLTGSKDAPSRWVGRDALRDLDGAKVRALVARRGKQAESKRPRGGRIAVSSRAASIGIKLDPP